MNATLRYVILSAAFILAGAVSIGMAIACDDTKRTWDFESDEPGMSAKGFANEVGEWVVAKEGANKVLHQKAKNPDAMFNVTLAEGTSYKNVDLSVKLRAVAGDVDRGGGVVWRAKDKQNYYICRYNPLEDNFRVYKVVDGVRTMFKNAKAASDEKWHFLRVTMVGPKITCYLDGEKLLEAEDASFKEAGMIGLWSKADAQSYFDDLSAAESD
jgi:3-keto-disaccharide hydrolase